jgi:hypothetical protein
LPAPTRMPARKSHKNLLGVSQRVRTCPGVSQRLRQCHAPHRAVVLMGCQRPNLGIRCNAWCRVCAKSRKLLPTPAKDGRRLGRQRPGTERVTPCLPGRLQRFLRVLVAATHRRSRGRDECRAPRQRRGDDREESRRAVGGGHHFRRLSTEMDLWPNAARCLRPPAEDPERRRGRPTGDERATLDGGVPEPLALRGRKRANASDDLARLRAPCSPSHPPHSRPGPARQAHPTARPVTGHAEGA